MISRTTISIGIALLLLSRVYAPSAQTLLPVQEVRGAAFKTMNACLQKLSPTERILPPQCVFTQCNIKIRSCWQEGIMVVQEQLDTIEKKINSETSSMPMRHPCMMAMYETLNYEPPYEFVEYQDKMEGGAYEYAVPPQFRGQAAILTRLVSYEIWLSIYSTYKKHCP